MIDNMQNENKQKLIRRRSKNKTVIANCVIGLALIAVIFTVYFGIPFIIYQLALNDYKNGDYDNAIKKFVNIEDYLDSCDKLIEIKLTKASCLVEQKSYDEAISIYEDLLANSKTGKDYLDYSDRLIVVKLGKGTYLMKQKMYEEALSVYENLNTHITSDEQKNRIRVLIKECKYKLLLDSIKTSPDSGSVYELYKYAKDDYKDSRKQFYSVCTTEWLFNQLIFSDIEVHLECVGHIVNEEGNEKPLLHIYTTFKVYNAGPFPVQDSILVLMEVRDTICDTVPIIGVGRYKIPINEPLHSGEMRTDSSFICLYSYEGDNEKLEGSASISVDAEHGLNIAYKNEW